VFSRRHWIPPGALIFSQIAHGFSWLLLLWIGLSVTAAGPGLAGIAWVHVVALGWATMAAVGILLHVIPAFTDVTWRWETLARWSVAAFGLGVVVFVLGLLAWPQAIAGGAALILLALIGYCIAAFSTLAATVKGERVERAVGRALAINLLFLLLTAFIGAGLASMLSGMHVPAWLAALPASHADLGMFGWASLLIFGVSVRTIRPISGERSRFPSAHIIVGTSVLLGVVLLAIGLAASPTLAWIGGGLIAIGAIVYAVDMVDVLSRATVPHRAPQAFVVAGIIWLLLGLVLGAGTLMGQPWQAAFVFLILAGWIGQMIDAHIHHIGVRLLATIYRGDDDETRPEELLDARRSWFAFAAFQIAIACGAIGLLGLHTLVAVGGAVGFIGWLAMMRNLATARSRAMRTEDISLL